MAGAQPVPVQGICSTCIHLGGCLCDQDPRYAVWHCEHFTTEAVLEAARAPLKAIRACRPKPAVPEPAGTSPAAGPPVDPLYAYPLRRG